MKRLLLVAFILGIAFCGAGETLAADTGDLDKALAYYHKGRFVEAARYLQEYVDQRPDPKGYYLLGYSLYKLKRFSEAEGYFAQAYLIDPTFSPEKDGLPRPPVKKAREPKAGTAAPDAAGEAPTKQAPAAGLVQKGGEKPSSAAPSAPAEPKQAAKPAPAPSGAPGSAVTAPAPPQAPRQAPQTTTPTPSPQQPQTTMPQFPPAVKQPMPLPGMGPGLISGLLAGFAMIILGIVVVVLFFYGLCMYLIAKKLAVPAAWTGWLPIINSWTLIKAADKPATWLLILFSPILGSLLSIINPFVGGLVYLIASLVSLVLWVYLWMCTTENLGHSKWLGLLIIPLSIFFMAYLAFSRSAAASPSPGESIGEDLA